MAPLLTAPLLERLVKHRSSRNVSFVFDAEAVNQLVSARFFPHQALLFLSGQMEWNAAMTAVMDW